MLKLTPEQYKLLCLPDPGSFLPKLAKEVRNEYPKQTAQFDDASLLDEVERSYLHASHQLGITHLPTLVRWVKADVAWAHGLRNKQITLVWMKQTTNPNVTAADLLSMLGSDLGT